LIAKNYISKPILTYTLKDDGIINSSINTYESYKYFSFNGNNFYWVRPTASYKLKTSSPISGYPNVEDIYSPLNPGSDYYKASEISSYDYLNRPLEIQSKDGITKRFRYKSNSHDVPDIMIVNGTTNQFAIEDFNNYSNTNSDWYIASSLEFNYDGRTGVEPKGSSINSENDIPAGEYYLSMYITHGLTAGDYTVTVSGHEDEFSASTQDQWTYVKRKIVLDQNEQITILGSVQDGIFFDDIRLVPADEQYTLFDYEPLYGLKSITDSNDRNTYYEYDDIGRLKFIKDQEGNIVKAYEYKYDAGN